MFGFYNPSCSGYISMSMACLSHGGGIWGSHYRYRPAPPDGYIIGQLHWLSKLSSKLSSFLVIRHRVIYWRPLCVRMVAECGIRLSWDLVRRYTFPVVLDFTMQYPNAQVCPWIVPGCHILNASHTDLCVDRHVE